MNVDRTILTSRAIRGVDWLSSRRRPFHWSELAEALEIGRRSTYRWLQAFESNGLVEVDTRPGFYRCR